jgi:hypothetical protein
MGLLIWVVIAFAVVILGSVVIGRKLQQKGRDMERHRDRDSGGPK